MGRFAAIDSPAVDACVADAIREIGGAIDAMRIPRLRGVVLGGGYGRGEGGVFVDSSGAERLYNDLDFYVVAEAGASGAELAAINAALAPLSAEWTARLGVHVDFCPAKTTWRIRHDEERVMIQELVHGYVDVAGEKGAALFAGVVRRGPEEFPWDEAARLLMNRGMGLALARESGDAGFVARNVNKCILGAGDAVLIARGGYRWAASDRAAALGDARYSAAVEWKFRPRAEAPAGWEDARAAWLAAKEEVFAAGRRTGAMRRTVRQAARWIARRRTVGDLRTLGLPPSVRIAGKIADAIRERRTPSASLVRDWEVFN